MTQKYITMLDGKKIPQIGLGVWQATNDETEKAVTTAFEAGYRSIDTATVYENEKGVGAAIKNSALSRKEMFITTKLWNPEHNNVRGALNKSLELLELDYVDSYLIHWPAPSQNLYVSAWEELIRAQEDGLVRSIGVSNFLPEHIERIIKETGVKPTINQIELHPLLSQKEMSQWCTNKGIKVQAWSPLAQGGEGIFNHKDIIKIANHYGKSPAQIVLRWHIQNNIIAIPKSVTPSRIIENFNVFDFELTLDDLTIIDKLNQNKRLGPHPLEFE